MISYKRPTSSTRDGIEQLGSSFGSIFLLFHECSWDHAHSVEHNVHKQSTQTTLQGPYSLPPTKMSTKNL